MLVAVVAGAGTAAAIDLRTRRIPNAVSAATAALGIALAATGLSGISLASSMLGFLFGLLLMLPGHVLGATGGGDVKLMAAVGAVLGIELMPIAFVCTAIAGGVLAVLVAKRRGRLAATIGGTGRIIARQGIEPGGAHNKFSYGPAIAAGALLAAWLGR
jgi:prepilin peptidase CpaA